MSHIEEDLYKLIIENVVIVCVDVLAKYKGDAVLIKRKTEPMKDVYWPIGGRVMHGETYFSAALRKLKEEANIIETRNLKPIGIYEDIFDKNAFKTDTVYHTLSIVFECEIDNIDQIKIDDNSLDWKLSKELPERFNIKSLI